jgi:glutathione S-transferase
MTMSLTLYTNPQSRGRIARWMLEETGAPYDVEVLGYATSMKAPAYLAINPMGKVPAIKHGDTVVTECAAICAYLADAFPAAGLAPAATDARRGDYYRWLFFAAGPLEQATTNQAAGFKVEPGKERMFGYGTYRDVMDTLDGKLKSSSYVTGATFSAADVYLGSALNWGMLFGTVEKRQSFADYVARLTTRPAYVRANEKDDALAATLVRS